MYTSNDYRLRQAFEAVLRKTSLRRMDEKSGHSSQNVNMGSTKKVSLVSSSSLPQYFVCHVSLKVDLFLLNVPKELVTIHLW